MKYFRFSCGLNPESSHDSQSGYNDMMREINGYCGYLARMYEFYFPATRTGDVSALTVCLTDRFPENIPQGVLSGMTVYNVIDWAVFIRLTLKEKPLYIIELCQQAITELARRENWNTISFQTAFEKIKSDGGRFRDHWKKPVSSPNKQLKAQIYFEDDYEKNGTFVDFTDKKGTLIKRVQFTPRGYSVYCKDIGTIKWSDDSHVKIYYKQTSETYANCEGNNQDYWMIGTDGTIEFHYPRAEHNPHGLFSLGVLYWDGTTIIQDKEKGLALIKRAAEMKYKHARKWLEQNG